MRAKHAKRQDHKRGKKCRYMGDNYPQRYWVKGTCRSRVMADETDAILADSQLMRDIEEAQRDIRRGRVEDAADVFAELDAEFADEGAA